MKIPLSKLFIYGTFFLLTGGRDIRAQDAASSPAPNSPLPEVWLDPRNPARDGNPADYWDLFQPNAVWSGMAQVNVFGLTAFAISHAPDDKLVLAFTYMREHHIKLDCGILPLKGTGGKDGPGHGVEGFSANPEEEAIKMAKRVQSLGGVVDSVSLDEPLWFGHYYSLKNACHFPIADVARQTAATVKALKTIFPDAKVMEAEPLQSMMLKPGWQADLQEWFSAYRAGAGESIDGVILDVQWSLPLNAQAPALMQLLENSHVKLGVIFNGQGNAKSDAMWLRQGEENIQIYHHISSVPQPPVQAHFASWNKNPTRVLPSTSPTALTHLIDYYFSPEAKKDPPVAFKRMFKAGSGYFSTADPEEISSQEAQGWSPYKGGPDTKPTPVWPGEILGGVYWKNPDGAQGLVPLDRLFQGSTGFYAYAASPADEQKLIRAGYVRQSVAGYVFSSGDSGGVPLHDLYDASSAEYCYVSNDSEYQKLLQSGWTDQGITCYLPPRWQPGD